MEVSSPELDELQKIVEKNTAKLEEFSQHFSSSLDEQIHSIEELLNELHQFPMQSITPTHCAILNDTAKRSFNIAKQAVAEHRGLNGGLAKIQKTIEKHFLSDYSSLVTEGFLNSDEAQGYVNNAIHRYLLRKGMLDAAGCFSEQQSQLEGQQQLAATDVRPYQEMHDVISSMAVRDLTPLDNWVRRHRAVLADHRSPLEFQLHRLRFVQLLSKRPVPDLLVLDSLKVFSQFAAVLPKEFSELMGCLVFCGQDLRQSPYSRLLDDRLWEETAETFRRAVCSELQLPLHDPLSLCLEVGSRCVAPAYDLRKTLQKAVIDLLSEHKDAPMVAVDLGVEHMYHSVFVCPIMRQQVRPNNPPVRLNCGHVISRDALQKLAQSNQHILGRIVSLILVQANNRLKCPYCPTQINEKEVQELKF